MVRRALLVALALSVAACVSREERGAPISDALTGTSLGPKAYQPQDFVIATRPSQQQFMAVGVTPPPRSLRPKTPAELAVDQSGLTAKGQAAAGIGAAMTAEGARVKAAAPKPPTVD